MTRLELLALLSPPVLTGLATLLTRGLNREALRRRRAALMQLGRKLELSFVHRQDARDLTLEGEHRGTRVRVSALPSGGFDVAALASGELPGVRLSVAPQVQMDDTEAFRSLPRGADVAQLRAALDEVVKAVQTVEASPRQLPARPSELGPPTPVSGFRRWIRNEAEVRRRMHVNLGRALMVLPFVAMCFGELLSGWAWMPGHSLTHLGIGLCLAGAVRIVLLTHCPACGAWLRDRPQDKDFHHHCPACGVRLE